MNTQVTRPGHMVPKWSRDEVGGWGDLAEDTPAEAKAEARAARWLTHVQWFATGACVGCILLWAALLCGV